MMTISVTISALDMAISSKRERERSAVDAIVHTVLGRDVEVKHRADGSPVLEGERLNISISHCADVAVVALSATACPGVDVELRSERLARVVPRVLSEAEMALDPLEAWTAKEAVFKAALTAGVVLSDIALTADEATGVPCRAECCGREFALHFLERGERAIALAVEISEGRPVSCQ